MTPSPIYQDLEKETHTLIPMIPAGKGKEIRSRAREAYLTFDLQHWLLDLESRKKEGAYYLNYSLLLDSDESKAEHTKVLSTLLQEDIPTLYSQIKNQLKSLSQTKPEQLRGLQKAYFRLCERFNEIKFIVLKEMEGRRRLSFY